MAAVEIGKILGATVIATAGGARKTAFAKAHGARVITTVSSAEKAKVALEAGADHAIDYRREHVGEREMASIEVGLSAGTASALPP